MLRTSHSEHNTSSNMSIEQKNAITRLHDYQIEFLSSLIEIQIQEFYAHVNEVNFAFMVRWLLSTHKTLLVLSTWITW